MNRPTTPVKIYLAAPWTHRADAKRIGELLEQEGFTLSHKWWDIDGGDLDNPANYEFHKECALKDLHGVIDADVVVVLQLALSEGKAVETGAALVLGIPVIIVNPAGKRGNIFQTLCTEVDYVYKAVELIREWYPRPVSA